MSTQKQRHTKGRRDRARVQFKLSPKKLTKCSNCASMINGHIACPKCGYYKGKEVINTLKKIKKTKQKA